MSEENNLILRVQHMYISSNGLHLLWMINIQKNLVPCCSSANQLWIPNLDGRASGVWLLNFAQGVEFRYKPNHQIKNIIYVYPIILGPFQAEINYFTLLLGYQKTLQGWKWGSGLLPQAVTQESVVLDGTWRYLVVFGVTCCYLVGPL